MTNSKKRLSGGLVTAAVAGIVTGGATMGHNAHAGEHGNQRHSGEMHGEKKKCKGHKADGKKVCAGKHAKKKDCGQKKKGKAKSSGCGADGKSCA